MALFLLLTQFILVTIISKVDSWTGYTTENLLRVDPLTERLSEELGWNYKWTEKHCSPGTLITGYNLSYNDDTDSLEHIAALCSNPNEFTQESQLGKQILSVGVPLDAQLNVNQDMNTITVSSPSLPTSYANGFISVVHGAESGGRRRHGFAFHTHPLKTSIGLMKGQQDGERARNWRIQNVTVYKCTQGFALCGISAEIASLADRSGGNATGQGNSC